MSIPSARTAIASAATALLLSLIVSATAAAQVATLSDPASEPEPTAAPVAEELAGEEALLEFAACMREAGIDMDDPQFGSGGGRFGFGPGADGEAAFDPQSSEFQDAMSACDGFLEALRPDLDAEEQAERTEQQLAVAVCMREQGWDLPDPSSEGAFRAALQRIVAAGIELSDPAFQEDISDCQAESGLTFGPPGGGADG